MKQGVGFGHAVWKTEDPPSCGERPHHLLATRVLLKGVLYPSKKNEHHYCCQHGYRQQLQARRLGKSSKHAARTLRDGHGVWGKGAGFRQR